jgi:hypothetical protein
MSGARPLASCRKLMLLRWNSRLAMDFFTWKRRSVMDRGLMRYDETPRVVASAAASSESCPVMMISSVFSSFLRAALRTSIPEMSGRLMSAMTMSKSRDAESARASRPLPHVVTRQIPWSAVSRSSQMTFSSSTTRASHSSGCLTRVLIKGKYPGLQMAAQGPRGFPVVYSTNIVIEGCTVPW